jgi:hypothetical protein
VGVGCQTLRDVAAEVFGAVRKKQKTMRELIGTFAAVLGLILAHDPCTKALAGAAAEALPDLPPTGNARSERRLARD